MKTLDFGQSLSILANVGVIIGIAFLAIQIRDSNDQARAENQIAFIGQSTDWLLTVANDADAISVYVRGMKDFSKLSEEDKVRFDFILRALLGRFSGSIAANNEGLGVSGNGFEARNVRDLFENAGFRQWWAQMDRGLLPTPTVRFIDQIGEIAPSD